MTVTRICSDLPNYCMDYYLSDCIRLSNVVFAVKYLYFNTPQHPHTHTQRKTKEKRSYLPKQRVTGLSESREYPASPRVLIKDHRRYIY